MIKYFGNLWQRSPSEETEVPVGDVCIDCGEPIEAGDSGVVYSNGPVSHRNCFLRGIIGSVAHLEKRCSCYIEGADETDPVGMTKRQAADAAVELWERRNDAEDY